MPIKYLTFEQVRYAPSDEIAPRVREHVDGALVFIGRLGIVRSKQSLTARIWRGRVIGYVRRNGIEVYHIRPIGYVNTTEVMPFNVCATRDAAKKKIVELIDTFQHALIALEQKL